MIEPVVDACPSPVDAPLSHAALLVVAYEWGVLTHFAETTPALVLPPGDAARYEAARYLRYDSALTYKEWGQVEAFVQSDHADPISVMTRPGIEGVVARCSGDVYSSGDGITFDAESVAQLWRLVFGYAAQYTRYAERLTGEYLRTTRQMTEAEWNEIDALLTAWEADK